MITFNARPLASAHLSPDICHPPEDHLLATKPPAREVRMSRLRQMTARPPHPREGSQESWLLPSGAMASAGGFQQRSLTQTEGLQRQPPSQPQPRQAGPPQPPAPRLLVPICSLFRSATLGRCRSSRPRFLGLAASLRGGGGGGGGNRRGRVGQGGSGRECGQATALRQAKQTRPAVPRSWAR